MTISRLPQQDAKQLDAALNITSAVVLAKELVDNALDAGATSIDVFISEDALQRIEVRDNGRGIQEDDFDALGRPSHTSKLGSFDELETIGGSSLGFRGLALASINGVAEVTVITRTAEDQVSAVLQLQPGGGVDRKGSKSGPVGTSVIVSKVFARQPVRAQAAKKPGVAKKNIAKIKELVQSYALARPHTKLGFKVVGDDKPAFSYSPQPHFTIKETVMQVLGSELAKQCRVHTTSPGNEAGDDHGRSDYKFGALLPCMNADFTKLSAGPFFSVDSRPVGSARGTMKKIYSTYKSCLSRVFGQLTQNLKSPFLRLDIKCPPGSYDPNIEPTKNDVLFTHEQSLLESFDCFLREVFTQPQVEAELHGEVAAQVDHGPSSLARSSALMAATDNTAPTGLMSPPSTGPGSTRLLSKNPQVPQREPVDREDRRKRASRSGIWQQEYQAFPSFSVDMSAPIRTYDGSGQDDESHVEETALVYPQQCAGAASQEQSSDPLENVNPWSIAKMTAPKRKREVSVPADEHGAEADKPNSVHHRSDTPFVDENLPILRQPFLPDGDLDVPHPPHEQLALLMNRLESQEKTSLDQRRREQLAHLVDRLETPVVMSQTRQTRSPSPARGRHDHLQSPPTSSPVIERRTRESQPNRQSSRRRGGMQQTRLNFGGPTKRSQRRNQTRVTADDEVDFQEPRFNFESPTDTSQRGNQMRATADEDVDIQEPRGSQWTAINDASQVNDTATEESQHQALPEGRTSLRQGQLPPFRPHFIERASFKPRGSMADEGQGQTFPVRAPSQRQLVEFTTGRGRSRHAHDSFDQANVGTANDGDLSKPMQIQLPENDPRAYLLRRQRSMATKTPRKRRRVMDELLPLEKVTTDGDNFEFLRQVLEVQPQKLGKLVFDSKPYLCDHDCNFKTLVNLTASDVRDLGEKLKRLVEEKERNGLPGKELGKTSWLIASNEETGRS